MLLHVWSKLCRLILGCMDMQCLYNPLPTYRRFMTHLQQMTFVNIVAKEEIAHEQFLLLPQCFQPYPMIFPLLEKIFYIFVQILFSKSSVTDFLHVGKG